jgi:signal transduction histidine kinase/CheY-like chemotaxis protein
MAAAGELSRPIAFRLLPAFGQMYVGLVIGAGIATVIALMSRSLPLPLPHPWMFLALVAWTCVASLWKVALPVGRTTGSTLSVSYAANLMTLLLLGPEQAVLSAVAGAWTQCWFRTSEPAPLHRTLFSMAVAAITMAATGVVYRLMGGSLAPTDALEIARPLVAAIAVYFIVNTGLVAGAVGIATGRTLAQTWRRDFLWSGASFIVAGTAGAVAAITITRGEHWQAALLIAPVYLAYRTYVLFVGRLDDERRHSEEAGRLHQQTMEVLEQAHAAERALAAEKERLAKTVSEMTLLQQLRDDLLEREQAARANAESANQIKDQFLAVVSHELRTPLNAILGWADMLHRNTMNEAARDRATRSIFLSAKRQAQLIDDLLDVARISAGKLRLERAAVDLADSLQEALHVVQPGAEAKGVQLIVDVDPAGGPVHGDAARLQQVVWNLLSNAVKFTPAGGTVRVSLRRLHHEVTLIVADTGQGITADFLPRVFDAFRQADASTTRAQPGLGLGLSIVRSLVEAHGGAITVHSDGPGTGATFTAHFPARAGEATRGRHAAASPAGATPMLDGIRVLVVEDDDESREVIAAHLEQARATVATACSVAQAFDVLRAEPIDVLLADIGMPGEDGYSLIRRLRRGEIPTALAIPAAALTAFAREEDRRYALDAGFEMHVPKPVEPQLLITLVDSLHRRRLAPAAN